MGLYQDRDIFDLLLDLKWRLDHTGGSKSADSPIDRYRWFMDHSEHGKRCGYAIKTKELFFKYDWNKVRAMILELAATIEEQDPVKDGKLEPSQEVIPDDEQD